MLLLPLLLVALQDAPAGDGGGGDLRVLTGGAIEAPEAPHRRSRSRLRESGRKEPRGRDGAMGRLRTPIGSLMAVRGQEDNTVTGIGLVTGLAGTGDSGELARQLLKNLLLTQNVNVDVGALSSKNLAVVRVEARIPAGAEPGRSVDVVVSAIGDAKSLYGGVLAPAELTDLSGAHVYATASGPLTVGGYSVDGDGASATKNHTTVGVLPGGGKIEREVPTYIVSDHGYLYLDVRLGQDSFGNVVRVTDAINALYPSVATVLPDGKSVRVRVPDDLAPEDHVAYLDSILGQEIESENLARVVVNERTGVVVMGGDVRLRPGAIAHGSIVVTIAETPEASQPGPLSNGTTERLDRTDLDVVEENNGLVVIPGAVTLQEVVDVLNVLGANPRDMISILTAMSDGGLLVAEIRRL